MGNYMIACVDADYDYLLQKTTPTSRMVNTNPYVFHTYAYAIENYQCYAESLHRVCVMATLNDRQMIDFEDFMREYSLIVWPLFVWSVWVYRHNHYREFTLTEFGNHVTFNEVNVYHPEQTLDFVRRKVGRKIAWLQHHFPQAKKNYEQLKQELLELGLTPETTYLYIQGHTLFDNVVSPLLSPVCILLRKEREKEIRRLAEHDIQRQNELSCYQHSQNAVEDMLRKNVGFQECRPLSVVTGGHHETVGAHGRRRYIKYLSSFLMNVFWQNTTTLSPAWICVIPFTCMPSPLRTTPPMVTPRGSPRSLTSLRVTRVLGFTSNSATSASATVRHFTSLRRISASFGKCGSRRLSFC